MNKLSFFWYIQIQTNSIHFGKNNNICSLNWANYTERLFFALLHEYFTLCSPKISYTSAAPETRDKYNVCASVVAIFQKNIISPENLTCGARLFSNITFMWQVIGIATTLPTPITNCQLSLKSWALGSKKCVCIIEKKRPKVRRTSRQKKAYCTCHSRISIFLKQTTVHVKQKAN